MNDILSNQLENVSILFKGWENSHHAEKVWKHFCTLMMRMWQCSFWGVSLVFVYHLNNMHVVDVDISQSLVACQEKKVLRVFQSPRRLVTCGFVQAFARLCAFAHKGCLLLKPFGLTHYKKWVTTDIKHCLDTYDEVLI